MKELRITKARMVEVINHYRGMYTGVADELKRGGIDSDKPYTQKLDPATGDYIYMQDEPEEVVKEVEVPMSQKGLSKARKKGPEESSGAITYVKAAGPKWTKKKKQAKKSKKGKK